MHVAKNAIAILLIKRIVKAFCLIFLLLTCISAFAMKSFVVKKIKVEGLHRIQYGTVLNYLPIEPGQELQQGDTAHIIHSLYKAGFFSQVSVSREGNILIIHVKERPTVGHIEILGKTSVTKENLLKSFKSVGLSEGQIFNQSVLDNVRDSIQNRLYERGNYAAKVTTHVKTLSDNRVAVQIRVDEGSAATIKEIKIIGNHDFTDWTLLNKFALSSPRPWALLTKQDKYSREKLDADIERLRSFYMDKGYIEFAIDSVNVSMTPDKKEVYITIYITEGTQYHISGVDIIGQTIIPRETLLEKINYTQGEIFSRKKIAEFNRVLGDYLAEYGYAYATIRPIPEIDHENKTVLVILNIEPGQKYYIRHIYFKGNAKTEDIVLRREMRQEEGAISSLANIRLSERKLNLLGFFKGVNLRPTKVPGTDDQMDLTFEVAEVPSARITAGAGYSDTQGILLNGGFNQTNFLGMGKSIGFNFSTSSYVTKFSFDFFNPYYTEAGIGRGFNIYAKKTDYKRSGIEITDYIMDQYGANLSYSLPITEDNNIQFGLGYQRTELHIGGGASLNLQAFEAKNGEDFQNALLSAAWSYVDLDRAMFPTEGYVQNLKALLAAPLTSESLTYYKLHYAGQYYYPFGASGYILSLRGEAAYGNGLFGTDTLPFYENYYAGGIGVQGSVRGYKGYSIGPIDSKGEILGGNFLVDGTIALIVPQPFARDTLRTSLFVDMGNVYTNADLLVDPVYYPCSGQPSGPLRFSAGIALQWNSPMGPLLISFAKAINEQPCDTLDIFQFTVGAG